MLKPDPLPPHRANSIESDVTNLDSQLRKLFTYQFASAGSQIDR